MAVKKTMTRSQEFSDSVIDTIREPLIILDHDLRVVTASRSFYEFFKVKPEETVGKLIYDLGNKQWDIPMLRELLETILPEKATFDNYEVQHDFATIGKRIMLLNARQIERVLGKEHIILLAIEDITERRQAEEELKEKDKFVESIIQSSAVATFVVNPEHKVIYWNKACEDLTGTKSEDLLGTSDHWKAFYDHPHPCVADIIIDNKFNEMTNLYPAYTRSVLIPDGIHAEGWYPNLGGKNRYIVFDAAPIRDDHEKIWAVIETLQDITELKRSDEALHRSETKFRTLYDSTSDAVMLLDENGFFDCNEATLKIFGCATREEFCTKHLADFSPPQQPCGTDSMALANRMIAMAMEKGSIRFEWMHKRNGTGETFLADVLLNAMELDGKQVVQAVVRDITERKRKEEIIRQSEERYRTILDETADAYYEVDLAGNFTFVNDAICRHIGYSREELLGTSFRGSIDKEDIKTVYNAFSRIYTTGKPERDIFYRVIRKDGTTGFAENSGFPLQNKKGEIIGFRGIGRDITERKQAEEKIQYLATHDTLTGLPNRSMFSQLLNYAIQTAQRYGRQFAVLFIDLDRFKIINDTLGHEAGDQLLKEIATRLKQQLRAVDVVGRLGGDEFVILIEEVSDSNQVATVAHKILTSVIKPITLMGQESRITASIGICMYPKDAEDEQSLMKNADIAMYLAKEEGKNNYQFYSKDIQSKSLEHLSIETNLRFALEHNELSLHYQAKVDCKTNAITGVEALLRWQNPYLGSVTPTQFIPVAEESGLIIPIGKWVLKTACAQNVAWQQQGLPPVCMAVNLSLRQLTDDNLIDDIRTALNDSGMAPNLLELEITESMVMNNPARIISILTKIKSMGVRLAIDDFGTGYSSLAKIQHFPVDTLKIDRSFIRNILEDAEDKAIAEAIIAMGKTLSLTVVAEGVETVEQMSFLKEHSCDEMQGYYFSKPVVPEQFADLLREHAPSLPEWKTV
jgi:diguanylate cyclase (GGDEF)-like protein/PAS domain S-box-containing protein